VIQTRLPNLPRSPVGKLVSILEGECTNMGTGIYWEVFERTGSVEAYLTYCKTEEVSSDSSEKSETLDSKGLEGEK